MEKSSMRVWGERARTFFVTHLVAMSLVLSAYSIVSLLHPMPHYPVLWILTASAFVPVTAGVIAVLLKERAA